MIFKGFFSALFRKRAWYGDVTAVDAHALQKHDARKAFRNWLKTEAKPNYNDMLQGRLDPFSIIGFFNDAVRGRSCVLGIAKCDDYARQAIHYYIDRYDLDVEVIGHNRISEFSIYRSEEQYAFFLYGNAAHIAEILIHPGFEIKDAKCLKRFRNTGGYRLKDPVLLRQFDRLGLCYA